MAGPVPPPPYIQPCRADPQAASLQGFPIAVVHHSNPHDIQIVHFQITLRTLIPCPKWQNLPLFKKDMEFMWFRLGCIRGISAKSPSRDTRVSSYTEQMVLRYPIWTSQLLAKILHTLQKIGYLNCTVSDLHGISFSKWQERCPTTTFWMQLPMG